MCDGINHSLKEIYRNGWKDDYCHVVRWCQDCGAIVVDGEIDGRIFPGKIVKMMFVRSVNETSQNN